MVSTTPLRSSRQTAGPRALRRFRITALSALLALGVVFSQAPVAHSAATEVRTPLAVGVSIPRTKVAFGSDIVFGSLWSDDGGATWGTDPTLAEMEASGRWSLARNGQLFGLNTWNQVLAYTLSTGDLVTYPLPGGPWGGVYTSWVVGQEDATHFAAYDYVNGVAAEITSPPGFGTGTEIRFGPTGGTVWRRSEATGEMTFSATPSPSVVPGPAVTINGVRGWEVTDTDLAYATASPSGLSFCRRPLADLTAVPACMAVALGGAYVSAWVTLHQIGSAFYLIANNGSAYAGFLVKGTSVTPAGSSYLGQFFDGDSGLFVSRDADDVPSIRKLMPDGTTGAGFDLPSGVTTTSTTLVVAPDRVVGADNREGSSGPSTGWSRPVSAVGFGAETALPKRVGSLMASAGRTLLKNADGLWPMDRGVLTAAIAPSTYAALSGPYVAQYSSDGSGNLVTVVSKTDGTAVASFPTWSGVLFGSEFVSYAPEADAAGLRHVVIKDLTGATSDRSLDLAVGSAGCYGFFVWNDTIAASCGTYRHTVVAFSLITGELIRTLTDASWDLQILALGDSYALIGSNGYLVWDFATNTIARVTDGGFVGRAATDGIGHIAFATDTELVWQDRSSSSTAAGRVLGWLAPSSFSSGSWSPEVDATKPFSAGVLRISQGSTTIKDLAVPASTDGSLRGVSWDGTNAAGAAMPKGSYTATLIVAGTDGSGPVKAVDGTSVPTFQFTKTAPGSFAALSPSRLLDTRDGTGVVAGAVAGNGVVDLQVTGRGGVPSTGVGAVILNVTAVTPSGAGFLSVYPTGGAVPTASNINFVPGQVVPNLVVAKVGAGGKVSIRNGSPGKTHILADVAGYFADGTVIDPGGLTAVSPSRLLDSRTSSAVTAGGSVRVQAAGVGGVPVSGVSAVVVNLTAVSPAGSGFLTAFPTGGVVPNASNVNFSAGQVVPNLAFVKLAGDGSFTVKNSSPGVTHVVADVAGFVLDGAVTGSGMFVPLAPARVLDTRPAYGGSGAVGANAVKSLAMTGVGGVPASGVSGVVLNVTAVASAGGFLTVYPADVGVPNASNVNFTAGQVVPNLVAVKLSGAGVVAIRNGSPGSTNVIADVAGYFTS